MTPNAYGKILEVDLSSGKITKKDISAEFARDYIGGMGFTTKILYDETGPDVDPFGPDNIVVFAAGPLTGTVAPCSSRVEVATKSPFTAAIGTSNMGGVWGANLKRAGYDVIIIRKQSPKPVYLWINDEKVEIRDAGHLWGKDTRTATDLIKEELGATASVVAIGPAGENTVLYSALVDDYHHVAARCGAGAVLGSKKLKAIVVHGTGSVPIARPEALREAARVARERIQESIRSKGLGAGPPDTRKAHVERGSLPGKNYQTAVIPGWLETRGREAADKYVTRKEGTCHACPMSCFTLAEVNEGKYAGLRVSRATAPGVALMWGAKCAMDNLPAIFKAKELCHTLGLDYSSACGTIAFIMELFQRGIIGLKDTDGLDFSWGNEDAVITILDKIALRQGFGNLLADGSERAAKVIGKGAERYVMNVKGMELMMPDPRERTEGVVAGGTD